MIKSLGFILGAALAIWGVFHLSQRSPNGYRTAEVIEYKNDVQYAGDPGYYSINEEAVFVVNGRRYIATQRFCTGLVIGEGINARKDARHYADSLKKLSPKLAFYDHADPMRSCLDAGASKRSTWWALPLAALLGGAWGAWILVMLRDLMKLLSRRFRPA